MQEKEEWTTGKKREKEKGGKHYYEWKKQGKDAFTKRKRRRFC